MTKNQKLPTVLLTPTTKEEGHDRPIALADIVTEGWMTQADLDVCANAALRLFARGQQIAAQRGLVLVDTKYEFGKEEGNMILLIDEIHTPDSSRYWLASSVDDRVAQGLEPENIDKEFLRLWFRDRCDPYDANAVLPDAPRDLVIELSKRYIQLYEMITWRDFPFDDILPDSENVIADLLREQFADAVVDSTATTATAAPPL
jgi:phosphoribosylaminoimidazole-succinocarboxamide synthase